jgi:hypothetical protein
MCNKFNYLKRGRISLMVKWRLVATMFRVRVSDSTLLRLAVSQTKNKLFIYDIYSYILILWIDNVCGASGQSF